MDIKWDREAAKAQKDALDLQAMIGNCPNCGQPAKVLQDPWVNPNKPLPQNTNAILVGCSAECWRINPQAYIDAVKNMP